jgi:hypothetical protein
MKIPFRKIKNFKLITGTNLLEQEDLTRSSDFEIRMKAIETIILGIYLMNNMNTLQARNEYIRLLKPENEDERYDIIEDIELDELLSDVFDR